MLSRLDDEPGDIPAEVAVLVGHPAARDALDLRGADRESLREVLERDVDRDELA